MPTPAPEQAIALQGFLKWQHEPNHLPKQPVSLPVETFNFKAGETGQVALDSITNGHFSVSYVKICIKHRISNGTRLMSWKKPTFNLKSAFENSACLLKAAQTVWLQLHHHHRVCKISQAFLRAPSRLWHIALTLLTPKFCLLPSRILSSTLAIKKPNLFPSSF